MASHEEGAMIDEEIRSEENHEGEVITKETISRQQR